MNDVMVLSAVSNVYKYKDLIKQLVCRDLKLKYRRSVLGYLWSVLNPLMTMMVLTIVFSNSFRFSIENFPVYLLTGQVIFGFFSSVTSGSCFAVIENAALLKKTYVPKYIFVLSKVISGFVDFLFSLAALILVMIITKSSFSFYNLAFIIPSIEVFIFIIGISLLLSQANVFFRDIHYIYTVLVTALSYLTPLFYPLEILPEQIKFFVTKFNPLYIYVTMFRQCIFENTCIDIHFILTGFLWGAGSVLLGSILFYKNQNKFILFI